MERAHDPRCVNDARLQIYAHSMCESHLESLFDLYESVRDQKEHALCVFAFLTEVLVITGGDIRSDSLTRFSDLVIRLIGEVTRPSFFSEEVNREYFNLMTAGLQRSPKLFASDAGTEYLAVFGCSSNAILSATSKVQFDRQVKRLLLSFKQRDLLDQLKRSVFYSLMLKTILAVTKLDELKAFRLLSTTNFDVGKFDEVSDLASANLQPAKLAHLVLATRFIKVFQSSILLHVNLAKPTGLLTKQVDEAAYAKMIEDFTKNVLRSKETIHLMRLMPQLVHSGFVTQKTKEAVLASFEKMLNEHAVRERTAMKPDDGATTTAMIDTTGVAAAAQLDDSFKQFLGSSDRDFIQTFCVDAIRLKKQERITKTIKAEATVKMEESVPVYGGLPD